MHTHLASGCSACMWFEYSVPILTRDSPRQCSCRCTIHALLLGPKGSGKSGLVKALAGRKLDEQLGSQPLVSAAPVQHSSGSKLLVLTEVAAEAAEQELLACEADVRTSRGMSAAAAATAARAGAAALAHRHSQDGNDGSTILSELQRCDVLLVAFDSSSQQSFLQAEQLLLAASAVAGSTLPCLLVAAKEDVGLSQELQQQCARVAAELDIPAPVPVSSQLGSADGLFTRAVEAALFPKGHVPDTPARKARRSTMRKAAVYTGIGVTGLGTAYLCYKLYQHCSSSSCGSSTAAQAKGSMMAGGMPSVALASAGRDGVLGGAAATATRGFKY
jgi:hypothetical protein